MSTPESRGGPKHRASPPLQKVGGTCPPVHPRIYAHERVSSSVPSLEQRHGPVSRRVSVALRQRRDSGPWHIDLQVSRRPVVPSLFRPTAYGCRYLVT